MLRRWMVALAALLVPLGAQPAAAAAPVLVMYPFAVTGAVPEAMGAQLSAKIADEIKQLGGIQVVMGAPSAKPSDYRAAARAAGADLYFSGSIAPVGNGYSAIEQLVSTRVGTVQWSTTTQFRTLDEVTGQGERIRTDLLRASTAPGPVVAAAATPAPAAVAAPQATSAAPAGGFAVLPVTGSAIDGDRAYAARAIAETLQRRGSRAVTVGTTTVDPAVEGAAVCGTTAARTLVAGALDTTRVASQSAPPQTTAHIALRLYDCATHAFAPQPTIVNHQAPIANDAIRGAIEDAVSAFPAPS